MNELASISLDHTMQLGIACVCSLVVFSIGFVAIFDRTQIRRLRSHDRSVGGT